MVYFQLEILKKVFPAGGAGIQMKSEEDNSELNMFLRKAFSFYRTGGEYESAFNVGIILP